MSGVKLPKEKRSVEERKWRKFDPDEMIVILNAIESVWGEPVRGLDDDRRVAIAMLVRVLAFTAMRTSSTNVVGRKATSFWRAALLVVEPHSRSTVPF